MRAALCLTLRGVIFKSTLGKSATRTYAVYFRECSFKNQEEESMQKTIITVVGHDTVGIIAKVCTYLAENKINILDISQTIVDGYFNMMMIADTSAAQKATGEIAKDLDVLGTEVGVVIRCQHEDIFNMMHRI